MRCVITGQNVKIIARALHSLSRIGEDLFVEPIQDGIIFRTVNISQSAFSTFMFNVCFFTSYDNNTTNSISSTNYKIAMKSCLTVFKTPHCMDKNIEYCEILANDGSTELIFRIRNTKGHIMTHFLPIIDNVAIKLDYSKDDMVNKLSILSKSLSAAVKHFRSTHEEVTFTVTCKRTHIRNHSNVDEDNNMVRTEVSLQADEFEYYKIVKECSITFSLKELKAILGFSEIANFPVEIYFESAGKPVIFFVSNEPAYDAHFVVSTLPPGMDNIKSPKRRRKSCDISSVATPTGKRDIPIAESNLDIAPLTDDTFDTVKVSEEDDSNLMDVANDENTINNNMNNIDDSCNNTQDTNIHFIFKRCFETQSSMFNFKPNNFILAPDSDGLIDSD